MRTARTLYTICRAFVVVLKQIKVPAPLLTHRRRFYRKEGEVGAHRVRRAHRVRHGEVHAGCVIARGTQGALRDGKVRQSKAGCIKPDVVLYFTQGAAECVKAMLGEVRQAVLAQGWCAFHSRTSGGEPRIWSGVIPVRKGQERTMKKIAPWSSR